MARSRGANTTSASTGGTGTAAGTTGRAGRKAPIVPAAPLQPPASIAKAGAITKAKFTSLPKLEEQQAAWTHKAYEKELTSVNRWRGGRKLGSIAPAIGGAIARSRAAIRSGLADVKYAFGDTSGHHGRRFYTRAVAMPMAAGAMGGAGAGAAGLQPVMGGGATAGPAVTETLRQLEQPRIQSQPLQPQQQLVQPQMQAASAPVKPAPTMLVPAAAGAGLGAAGMGAAGMAGGMGGQPGARATPEVAPAPLKQPTIQQQQVQQQQSIMQQQPLQQPMLQSSQALPPSGVTPAQTLSSGMGGGALAGLAPQAGGLGSGLGGMGGGGVPLDMPILQAK